MDDGGQPPHSFGEGQQQRNQQHSRPFFYVQPPSQPYVPMYPHWHLNNAYNPYVLPGGYNHMRPYVQPYPYMHYPGYVLPHPQMQPMDYRRMFEPRFQPPPWTDMPQQHPQHPQHQPPPGPFRREMACSEVQTDPSDAINKLIECLGKIRVTELGSAERELDSGVGSQACGIFSPGDQKKSTEEGTTRATSSSSSSISGAQPCPGVTFGDSTTAVYGDESSRRSLEDLGTPGAWSEGFEEEPLDRSSVHEEMANMGESAQERDLFNLCLPGPVPDRALTALQSAERPVEVVGRRSDCMTPASNVGLRCDAEELLMKPDMEAIVPQVCATSPCHSPAQHQVEANLSYRILRLPFDLSSPSAGALLSTDNPSLCGAESAHLTSSCLSSPSPLYYGYLPQQKTHERMSVLSPSLDELSSRDEMFSTDLDDVDLFPRRVYASRRLADPVSRSSSHLASEEAWAVGSKKNSCACCGKGLAKVSGSRSQGGGCSARSYRDETGDSDDECHYARSQSSRVTSRKHGMPRKADSVSLRHVSKHPNKKSQCKEGSSVVDREEGHDLCMADGEMTSGDLQCITCQDQLCREDVVTGKWEGEPQPRRRPQGQLHKQEMCRKVPCKTTQCHRTRDEESKNEDQPSRYRWERGAGKVEPRC